MTTLKKKLLQMCETEDVHSTKIYVFNVLVLAKCWFYGHKSSLSANPFRKFKEKLIKLQKVNWIQIQL